MNEQQRKHNFNLLIAAFRQMKGSLTIKAGMLTIALNDTRWGAWAKTGITEDALAVVRDNLTKDPHNNHILRGLQAAHKIPRATYCRALLTEDLENPYTYMRSVSECVLATPEENTSARTGWDHFSKIYPVNPEQFLDGASNRLRKRHPDYPAFMALIEVGRRSA